MASWFGLAGARLTMLWLLSTRSWPLCGLTPADFIAMIIEELVADISNRPTCLHILVQLTSFAQLLFSTMDYEVWTTRFS